MSVDAHTGAVSFRHGGTPPDVVRAFIDRMARDMVAILGANSVPPVKHTFMDGIYMREMLIPKGTLLIGKVHKVDCINIVSKGDISILTEFGSGRVTAGYSSISPAGTQKMGYANEDTVFVNVFRTDETDSAKVEDELAQAFDINPKEAP